MKPTSILAAALAVPFFPTTNAFWRMNCAKIQVARSDPIIVPGQVSGHAHTVVGGSNFGVNATADTLIASSCSSCEIQDDKSAYWTPLLYFQYANGSFVDVPHNGAVMYYVARGPTIDQTVPFPKGMKMLSGNAAARSYDNTTYTWGNATYPGRPVADAISFACLTAGPEPPNQPGLINDLWKVSDCINNLRAQVHFPSCWNGVDLYKSDQSHVAHQSQIDDGVCPPDHPVLLPHLFMEVSYSVTSVPGDLTGGQYVFSMGDATGYGLHADFENGWEQDVLEEAVASCLVPDNFGQISLCPSLQASQTNGYASNCPMRASQINEVVTGLLPKLPGCINVTNGPGLAPSNSMSCPASVTRPQIFQTQDSSPQTTAQVAPGAYYPPKSVQQYLGCFNDSAGGVRALNDASYSNFQLMNVTYCQAYCNERGYRLSGMEYSQECHCANNISANAQPGAAYCTWNCGQTILASSGVQEICGGYGYISIYNNTNASFIADGKGNPIDTGSGTNVGAPQPSSSVPAAPYAANYLGCASDDVTSRTLQGESKTHPNMTLHMCALFAKYGNGGVGYQYYGLEYSTQCFAANVISSPGKLLSSTSSPSNATCSYRCGGAESQICGGPSALSVYINTLYVAPAAKTPINGYAAEGCLSDLSPQARSLDGSAYFDSYMTEDMCVKYCSGMNFPYAGVEYGTQCFCGTSIANGGEVVNCSTYNLMACPGNFRQLCGGSSVLNYWLSS